MVSCATRNHFEARCREHRGLAEAWDRPPLLNSNSLACGDVNDFLILFRPWDHGGLISGPNYATGASRTHDSPRDNEMRDMVPFRICRGGGKDGWKIGYNRKEVTGFSVTP
jgi:hypothetical protein